MYGAGAAEKYAANSRMQAIQTQMAERCIELLNIAPDAGPQLILDVGCGSGISGAALSRHGYGWIGVDISDAMLGLCQKNIRAQHDDAEESAEAEDDDEELVDEEEEEEWDEEEEEEEEEEGEEGEWSDAEGSEDNCPYADCFLRDMGDGMPFRAGLFDGVISVSALQWLCNADHAGQNPIRRMRTFFETLFACMRRSARAVLQVYPENAQQMDIMTQAALRAGFTGGLLVDYPNSAKAKKYYLTLFAGPPPSNYKAPEALGTDAPRQAEFESERNTRKRGRDRRKNKPVKKSREWVLKKKEVARQKGYDVKNDSKYTARKRRRAF